MVYGPNGVGRLPTLGCPNVRAGLLAAETWARMQRICRGQLSVNRSGVIKRK
jgi:hypothetical protein